jgi:hypothetical protein
VTASGWAAMINPSEGCTYAPALPHGPGAAGSKDIPAAWVTPIDVPTPVWIDLALAADDPVADIANPVML